MDVNNLSRNRNLHDTVTCRKASYSNGRKSGEATISCGIHKIIALNGKSNSLVDNC
jgi:hypothetical protein